VGWFNGEAQILLRNRIKKLFALANRALLWAGWAFVGLSSLVFLLSICWLVAERSWDEKADLSPPDAFRMGTLGLEIAPYKLVAVLDELADDALIRDPEARGQPWWEHYGFIDSAPGHKASCRLPVGFNVTHLLPVSGTPVPVQFVGLTCAACHSQRVHNASLGVNDVVMGAGSSSADVIAFSDALQQAVAIPALTPKLIQSTYAAKCGEHGDLWYRLIGRFIERYFISQWLDAFRKVNLADASKYDMPFHGKQLLDPDSIEAGPSRTRPFRSVIRNTLDLPAAHNSAFSKVPAAFEQARDLRPQSQFDGSIANTVSRSLIAAFTSGSHLGALARPPAAHNIRAAAKYTETLGPLTGVKTFAQMFPSLSAPDPQALQTGQQVYMQYCASCHGHRPSPDAQWDVASGASRIHSVVDVAELKTDATRVRFRYSEMLPTTLWITFPASPVTLGEETPIPTCKADPVHSLPAGTNLLQAQRAALDKESRKAVEEKDFVLAQYWAARKEQFDRDRRTYPAGHPLAFTDKEICSDPDKVGYFNNPIPLAYLRAPYLHNASVPTMRELLNMEDRPMQFCRGDDAYDPEAMGLRVRVLASGETCSASLFHFDATRLGNSNTGHDYPWTRTEIKDHPEYQALLEDLLLYLRTQ